MGLHGSGRGPQPGQARSIHSPCLDDMFPPCVPQLCTSPAFLEKPPWMSFRPSLLRKALIDRSGSFLELPLYTQRCSMPRADGSSYERQARLAALLAP